MKNFMKIMALVLCMLLVFPAALAQETPYQVGQPTRDAFAGAFASGKLVTAEVALDLELNAESLGMTAEDAQTAGAVLDALRQSKLTFGVGLIDDGLRLALGAELADAAGENPAGISALADVTLDGIAVESDVIAGKRVTAKWETILALCGLDESEIAMVLSLRDLDPEMVAQMITQMMEELEPMLEMAAQLALPYAETVVGFVQTLPIEVRENLTEEDYPPTATEISITITEKDLGMLVALLCDQLEQDNTLVELLDALLAEADAGVTVEEFIAELRDEAAKMTNTDTPVTFYLGMNESGVPMYVEAYVYNEPSGESIYGGLFLYQDADGVWQFETMGGLYDAQEAPVTTIYLGGSYQEDPADPNVCALLGEMYVYEGEIPLMEMVMTASSLKAEDSELAAYDTDVAMSMYVDDGDVGVQAVASAQGRQGLTENGGESAMTSATTDTYVGDIAVTQTEIVEQLVEPTADGGVTGYTKVTETMPASGVDKLEMMVTYFSEDIDVAASQALEQIALETVTNDEMNALMTEALAVITEEKLPAVMANLPAEVVQMIEASAQ